MSAEQLNAIKVLVDQHLASRDVLSTTKDLLLKIRQITLGEDIKLQEEIKNPDEGNIVISCDASVKTNPGGPAAVAAIIEQPGKRPHMVSLPSKANTNNQAEYEAIYTGLITLVNLNNFPASKIVIRSDSQIVIKQLKDQIQCQDPNLQKKKEAIKELVQRIPAEVSFEWMPRNSTKMLELANHLAQDLLGVPRH